MTKNKKILTVVTSLILLLTFLLFAILIDTGKIIGFDDILYGKVTIYNCDFMKYFSIAMSQLSSATVLILITILLCIDLKDKKVSYLVIINLLFSVVLNQFLKNIFVRERPFDLMIIDETGYSFPSGHSMISFAFYGYIIYLIYKGYLKTNHKYIASILITILIFLVGCSRVYLGVHYASDVLGGFVISGLYLILYIIFSEKVIRGEINLKLRSDYIKRENKKFLNSFKYAYRGIIEAFKSERNMKIHLFILLVVLVCGFLFNISLIEWIICLICFGLVISLEIINTSVETLVNLVSPKYNELARRIKDLSAGAVLFNAIVSFIVGIIIFLPKIIFFLK